VKLGQSVVVTSHTHSAVDNVLLKLAARHVDLLRLGSSSRIHPRLKANSEEDLTARCVSPAQLETLYNSKVGNTGWAISRWTEMHLNLKYFCFLFYFLFSICHAHLMLFVLIL
jgi:hypothetical protein